MITLLATATYACMIYVRRSRCASSISLSRYEFLIKNNSKIFRIQRSERVYGRALAHRITIAEQICLYGLLFICEPGQRQLVCVRVFAAREKYLRFLFVFFEFSELLTSFFLSFVQLLPQLLRRIASVDTNFSASAAP